MTVSTRRASEADLPGILQLARRALGWTDDDARFLRWKHFDNPFGPSPMWVALEGGAVVGFRTFLRWEFVAPDGRRRRAVRAVDTATDPDFQGRGIFRQLTLEAVDELRADDIDIIFNTPNEKSLPGYLKMGWREVGRLPVAVLPASLRFSVVVGTARAAADRGGLPTEFGERPDEVFADREAVTRLLADQAQPRGLATGRSPEFLAWRYGHPDLGYRVVVDGATAAGMVIFRLRRRGRAIEAVIDDTLVPAGARGVARRLIRRIARSTPADYLLRVDPALVTADPFVRLPGLGPVLACRPLDGSEAPPLTAWALTMGDVELF